MGFLSEIKGFLIDLDGVMYTGDNPVTGSAEAIHFLKDNGYAYRFVSNTTRKSRHTIADRLCRMGLEIPEEYIFTPPVAAVSYMKKNGKHRFHLILTGDADRDFPPATALNIPGGIDYVILGDAGDEITYSHMNMAFRDLMGGAELIALERDRYWMAHDGLALSAGPFVTALEFATGKNAILMGKPSRDFFDLALIDMGLVPEKVVMIGDDILTDIGGAHDAGMRGILVRTGKYREDLVSKSAVRPDLTIQSIAHIHEILVAAQHDHWETGS
jgi:HAD superfamily hydrolase (TIGR01458 family)